MAKWILGFDASTTVPTIVLGTIGDHDDALVASEIIDASTHQASATLIGAVLEVVARAGIEIRDLHGIACGRGPGTFTGSRVAAAAAKGLALGLACNVLPISTLAALAATGEGDGPVLALLDARRHEVYGGFFDLGGRSVTALGEERCATLADLLATQPRGLSEASLRLIGPGVTAYAGEIPAHLRARATAVAGPSTAGLWRAIVSAHRAGTSIPPAALEVTYLRVSYAEMGLNAPKRPFKPSPWV